MFDTGIARSILSGRQRPGQHEPPTKPARVLFQHRDHMLGSRNLRAGADQGQIVNPGARVVLGLLLGL